MVLFANTSSSMVLVGYLCKPAFCGTKNFGFQEFDDNAHLMNILSGATRCIDGGLLWNTPYLELIPLCLPYPNGVAPLPMYDPANKSQYFFCCVLEQTAMLRYHCPIPHFPEHKSS